jgi:hypothetical protein
MPDIQAGLIIDTVTRVNAVLGSGINARYTPWLVRQNIQLL